MADIRRKRKCRNWISALVAIYKTGEALENFTKRQLLSVHNHIKETVGDLSLCLIQCSQTQTNTDRWCPTCTRWRVELENFIPRRVRRNWHDTNSCHWPNSEQEIIEVFVLPSWRTREINMQDISTIFNIWNRCLQFPRPIVDMLERLKELRNELLHNTFKMKITNAKKKMIFQQIRNVVNHSDIKRTIPKHGALLQTLGELNRGKLFAFKGDVKRSLKASGVSSADIEETLDLIVENTNRGFAKLYKTLLVAFCIIAVLLAIFAGFMYDMSKKLPESNTSPYEASNIRKGIE